MFITGGKYIYDLPGWWTHRVTLAEVQTANGWAELTLPGRGDGRRRRSPPGS